jgi:hypothetical protein
MWQNASYGTCSSCAASLMFGEKVECNSAQYLVSPLLPATAPTSNSCKDSNGMQNPTPTSNSCKDGNGMQNPSAALDSSCCGRCRECRERGPQSNGFSYLRRGRCLLPLPFAAALATPCVHAAAARLQLFCHRIPRHHCLPHASPPTTGGGAVTRNKAQTSAARPPAISQPPGTRVGQACMPHPRPCIRRAGRSP